MERTEKFWNLLLSNFLLLLPKLYLRNGVWELASLLIQSEIFLILSYFLRSSVWGRLRDKSFDKHFCIILQSFCHCLKIYYLFEASWFRNILACTPSFKMESKGRGGRRESGGRNILVKNLVVCQIILISKRGCILGRLIFWRRNSKFLKNIENCIIAV